MELKLWFHTNLRALVVTYQLCQFYVLYNHSCIKVLLQTLNLDVSDLVSFLTETSAKCRLIQFVDASLVYLFCEYRMGG